MLYSTFIFLDINTKFSIILHLLLCVVYSHYLISIDIYFSHQTSMLALRIAKQKSIEMGHSLQASVGKVLNVTEESCEEWQGVSGSLQDGPITATQQHIDAATIHCKVKLYGTFELKHSKNKMS